MEAIMQRSFSAIDRLLMGADRSLKTLVRGSATAQRRTPSGDYRDNSEGREEQARRHRLRRRRPVAAVRSARGRSCAPRA